MARVLAFVPDLLFGSNVVGALQARGHQVQLVGALNDADVKGAEVLVVDLTVDAARRIERARTVMRADLKTLGFYSHVEADVRALAERSGFDLVVPRSRMAREGGALVDRLAPAT